MLSSKRDFERTEGLKRVIAVRRSRCWTTSQASPSLSSVPVRR